MPKYKYQCENEECQQEFFVTRSMTASKEVECEFCHEKCSNVVITGGAGIIDKTPRTVGMLAEQNRRKFGTEYCQKKEIELKARNQRARDQLNNEVPVRDGVGVRAEKIPQKVSITDTLKHLTR